jgi:hypothetical protein
MEKTYYLPYCNFNARFVSIHVHYRTTKPVSPVSGDYPPEKGSFQAVSFLMRRRVFRKENRLPTAAVPHRMANPERPERAA